MWSNKYIKNDFVLLKSNQNSHTICNFIKLGTRVAKLLKDCLQDLIIAYQKILSPYNKNLALAPSSIERPKYKTLVHQSLP